MCVYGLDWPINHADTKYLSRSPRPFLLYFSSIHQKEKFMCVLPRLYWCPCILCTTAIGRYPYNVYVTYPLFFLSILYILTEAVMAVVVVVTVFLDIEFLAFMFIYFLPFLFIRFYIYIPQQYLTLPTVSVSGKLEEQQ